MASDFVSSRSPKAFSISWPLESARKSLCSSALSLWYRGSLGSIRPTAEISMVPGSDLCAATVVAATGAAGGGEAGAVDAAGCGGGPCPGLEPALACLWYVNHAPAPSTITVRPTTMATIGVCDFACGAGCVATGVDAEVAVVASLLTSVLSTVAIGAA